MALPAHLLSRLSPELMRALKSGSGKETETAPGFSLGALDAVLPDGGFLRGGVVELSLAEGVPGTSLVLAACQGIQRRAEGVGSSVPWCAFVDPGETLHAPGVAEAGVRLDRLLVARPSLAELPRIALRLAKSAAFELVIVDLVGVRGGAVRVPLDPWARLVRRLAMEVDGTGRSVVLMTEAGAPRALPLPVAQRIEIARPAFDRLVARVAKDRRGHVTPPRPIAWTRAGRSSTHEEAHARTG
jgi:hypothetical protein